MLEFRNDRLDYGRLLIPPEGYRLDRAIAATYSLDLNTLLSIPVALFYAQTLEGNLQGERFQLLEAIQRTAGIVTVYCQHGQIHVPERYNRLFAFMEEMIIPVKMADAFSSFHPKVWVLRYRPEDSSQSIFYRVLVLSRNLTYDRNWDLAVALEGKVAAAQRPNNRPLLDFLSYLNRIHPVADYARFVRDLARVKFEPPEKFARVRFHPIGIPGHAQSPVLATDAEEALCMSPFVDDDTLGSLGERVQGKLWLFSRRAELEKLSQATVRGCKAHCLAERVVEGEREADDGTRLDCMTQDLHAKLFVFQQTEQTRWLVGSANATKAARERNVEFLVELIGSDRAVTLASVRDDLLDPQRGLNVFEEFPPELAGKHDLQAGRSQNVRRLEFALSGVPLTGSLAPAANQTNYDLTISLDLRKVSAPGDLTLTMAPMSNRDGTGDEAVPMRFGQMNQPVFANITEADLSQFVSFTISAGDETLRHFLLKYEISGLPTTRLDRIVKGIVANTDQFFEYLRFLLTDEFSKTDFERSSADPKKGRRHNGDDAFAPELPLFESMIAAASRDPDKMRAVDAVIQRLKTPDSGEQPLVPAAFLDFWEIFRPLIPTGKGKEDDHGN
jgi:hypothetical protein